MVREKSTEMLTWRSPTLHLQDTNKNISRSHLRVYRRLLINICIHHPPLSAKVRYCRTLPFPLYLLYFFWEQSFIVISKIFLLILNNRVTYINSSLLCKSLFTFWLLSTKQHCYRRHSQTETKTETKMD